VYPRISCFHTASTELPAATTRHCTYWLASAPVRHLLRSNPGAMSWLGPGPGSWAAPLPGSPPSSNATRRNNTPPSPPPIAIPRPPPPPDDAVVLVSICIPSLKVIALSVAVFGVAGGPARSALHTT